MFRWSLSVPLLCAAFVGMLALLVSISKRLLHPLYGASLSDPPGVIFLIVLCYLYSWLRPASNHPGNSFVTAFGFFALNMAFAVQFVDLSARIIDIFAKELVSPQWHPFLIHLFVAFPAALFLGSASKGLICALSSKKAVKISSKNKSALEKNSKISSSKTKVFNLPRLYTFSFLVVYVAFIICRIRLSETLIFPVEISILNVSPTRLCAAISIFSAVVVAFAEKWKFSSAKKYQRLIPILSLLVVCFSVFSSRHMNDSISTPYKIGGNHNISIISRKGCTMVVEDSFRGIRFLRAGSAILGGQYTTSRDSVFAVFYFHEMHRLLASGSKITKQNQDKRGLMIGFGVGVAAQVYLNDNVTLDAVEIDPDVFELAKIHFDFVSPHKNKSVKIDNLNSVVADGWAYLREANSSTYDFIVHDVFTSGAIPSNLFTFETFAHARRSLVNGGTISTNFVGRRGKAFDLIENTLRAVFPHVRCFAEDKRSSFTNFVFFASDSKILFRRPTKLDAFESNARWYSLNIFFDNEVELLDNLPISEISNPISEIQNNNLFDWENSEKQIPLPQSFSNKPIKDGSKLEKDNYYAKNMLTEAKVVTNSANSIEMAIEHWEIMRSLLPFDLWVEY